MLRQDLLDVVTGTLTPDLVQEVFLRLLRVERHESIRNPEAYVITVAGHVLHQHTLRLATRSQTVDAGQENIEWE